MFEEEFRNIGRALDRFFLGTSAAIKKLLNCFYKSDAFEKLPYWLLIPFTIFCFAGGAFDIVQIFTMGLWFSPALAAIMFFIGSPYLVGLIKKMHVTSKLKGKKNG